MVWRKSLPRSEKRVRVFALSLLGLVIVTLFALQATSKTSVVSDMMAGRLLGEPTPEPSGRTLGEPVGDDGTILFAAPPITFSSGNPAGTASTAADDLGLTPGSSTPSTSGAPSPSSSVATRNGSSSTEAPDVDRATATVERLGRITAPSVSARVPSSVTGSSSASSSSSSSTTDGSARSATTTTRPPSTEAPPTTTRAQNTTTRVIEATSTTERPRQTTTTQPPRQTTTTRRPTTTTAAPRPAPAQNAVLSASVDGISPFGFGQSRDAVTRALSSDFGALSYTGSTNWDDFAVVRDGNGSYIRTRSNVGNNSQKQFSVPVAPAQESYLVYSFFLEPGFDAGDGNRSDGQPVWGTGIKLPGLALGNPSQNTGGNHNAGGFTGRLMIRGTLDSAGSVGQPRDGLSLVAYVYGQQYQNQNINHGFGRDFYFLNGHGATPFEGINDGGHEGAGDPRIWDLREGQWVTVVLGYRVDGDNGWFKAWTKTGNGPLQENLFVRNLNWTGDGRTAGPDQILFQNFWGGSGSVWYPDSTSYMRFKDFGVFHSQSAALSFAR